MADLRTFADIIKKANDEKRQREIRESARKEVEIAPLLSELFASVAKAKEVRAENISKEAPLLHELQIALSDPQKFLEEKQEKKSKIVALVTELENQATDIREKIDIPETPEKEVVTDIEKKFLKLFNKLQTDFQTLKSYVSNQTHGYAGMGGSGGSGEVRILRMDDVSVVGTPSNGSVLTWSTTLNKFICTLPTLGGAITDEEMPYAKRVDFVSDNELFKGEAAVGITDDSPHWRIHHIIIGNDGDMTETWANGNSEYINTWSNRLTYSYS